MAVRLNCDRNRSVRNLRRLWTIPGGGSWHQREYSLWRIDGHDSMNPVPFRFHQIFKKLGYCIPPGVGEDLGKILDLRMDREVQFASKGLPAFFWCGICVLCHWLGNFRTIWSRTHFHTPRILFPQIEIFFLFVPQ